MSKEMDFRSIIEGQRKPGHQEWVGNLLDYLYLVKEDPRIADLAPMRVYNMIKSRGVKAVPDAFKIRDYEDLVSYEFFKDKMYGTRRALHDIMRFLNAAARRTETGKRILLLMGPPASGKSTIAALLKKGLEQYCVEVPKYAIKDCPIHEEPLHAIPEADRPYWEEQLGTKIEGSLCPACRFNFRNPGKSLIDESGALMWEKIPVTRLDVSELNRICIGTFQPSDPKSQDVSELIGRVNMAKVARYGETDPRGYSFDGEIQVANGGMIELVELLKTDIKLQYVFITLAQEQTIKSPGFPQMYVDVCQIAHTNQTEYDSFKADKKNEALHDRVYVVNVPLNIRVKDEIEIYKKMIRESAFPKIHLAPGALRVAAEFAVLTRLVSSTKVPDLVKKMKIYNGEIADIFTDKKAKIDIKALLQEGKEKGEGMFGISPRFVINALNLALASREEKGCITAIDVLRGLRSQFDHAVSLTDEDKEKFGQLLISEKSSVAAEYKEYAKEAVNMAFLHAFDEQAQALFDLYMLHAEAYCKQELVKDSVTGEYTEPDEEVMRKLEELIAVPQSAKDTFRNGVFVWKADALAAGEKFTWKSYPALMEAVKKKLTSDLKNVVDITIANPTNTTKKSKAKRSAAINTLCDKDRPEEERYCPHCANVLLKFVGEILRKEK